MFSLFKSRKKVLITGATGFAGSHLAEYLVKEQKYSLHGTHSSSNAYKNLEAIKEKIQMHHVDLCSYETTLSLLQKIKPEVVFHLAAFPSPAESFKNPAAFLTNNISAEVNLLEGLRDLGFVTTKVLIVSSSEVYGQVKTLPIDEEAPMNPVSPYGVSKIAQDYLGLQYHLAYQMPIIRVRPFGHLGPRLSPEFVVSAFAKKIAEIEAGKRKPVLNVGNLKSKRDLTDVRDMIRAYALLIDKGVSGEVYNAGRGESYQISEILKSLLALSPSSIEVKEDASLLRPNDIAELRCDPAKIYQATGWKAEVPLEQSLEDTLNYWREQV